MPTATRPRRRNTKHRSKRPGFLRRALYYSITGFLAFYLVIAMTLICLRWLDPPTTAVQIERRLSAAWHHQVYQKRYQFVALRNMSPQLPRAAVAAEDTNFYKHHGFDWKEIGHAVQQDLEEGKRRGASTITQQLVRNLFLSTNPSVIRKAFEFSIVPLAELILPKDRILELYLNVIEFGPGIYGVEAASRYYFAESSSAVSRDQAIALVEVLPAPLHWTPGMRRAYGSRIQTRMRQLGW